jgi:hypothetical protein
LTQGVLLKVRTGIFIQNDPSKVPLGIVFVLKGKGEPIDQSRCSVNRPIIHKDKLQMGIILQ